MNSKCLSAGWVPVTERCPSDNQKVLCWDGFNFCVGECKRYSKPRPGIEWWWRGEGPEDCWQGPTHWMPLPDVPNEKAQFRSEAT